MSLGSSVNTPATVKTPHKAQFIKTDIRIYKEFKPSSELQLRCVKLTSIDTDCVISSSNSMFDHWWSNVEFGEEMGIIELKYAPYQELWS